MPQLRPLLKHHAMCVCVCVCVCVCIYIHMCLCVYVCMYVVTILKYILYFTFLKMWFIWFLFPSNTRIVFYNGHDFIRGLWSCGATEFMQLMGKGNSWHFILTVFSHLNQNLLFNTSWAMFQCVMPDICQNWEEKICFSQIIPCNFLYLPKGHIKVREKCP